MANLITVDLDNLRQALKVAQVKQYETDNDGWANRYYADVTALVANLEALNRTVNSLVAEDNTEGGG